MLWLRHFVIHLVAVAFSSFFVTAVTYKVSETSIYDVLRLHGLPMGLLPEGVKNYSLDDSGKFQVNLDRACDTKFESELHYEIKVVGKIKYGEINQVSGISVQDLFLWLPVVEIRVDIPSSGLIYFNTSVVSKQFTLSSFDTPKECVASPDSDLLQGLSPINRILPKMLSWKIGCIYSAMKMSGKKLSFLRFW